MEDHVRGILIPVLALVAGTVSLVTASRSLAATAASVEWATLASLFGALAVVLGIGSRRAGSVLRASAFAAGVAGAGVVFILMGQLVLLVARGFRDGEASRNVGRTLPR